MLREVGAALREEATRVDERRLLVLAGDQEGRFEAAKAALDGADIPMDETTLVGRADGLRCERLEPDQATTLLGTTRKAVIVDCHDACRPNVLGRVVGAVDAGGLLVLLTPTLSTWPAHRDGFDEGLAVPPESVEAVGGRFRSRLVSTLKDHPGIAIVDLDADAVIRDGLTDPPPAGSVTGIDCPAETDFPSAAYERCLTQDQADALEVLEAVRTGPSAVVLEADRGRGKSSAAGLAAGSLALDGAAVAVTAPAYRNAAEVMARAEELLSDEGSLADAEETPPKLLRTKGGGGVRFHPPTADSAFENADVLIVDEAAALPVRVLETYLDVDRVIFATTVHGYEGTGRGFDVRFRGSLEAARHEVQEVRLEEPIRYAAGDPVEVWAFRALLLDARPPVTELIEPANPETVTYREIDQAELASDEHLLREVFGLLVYAHYRTEPDDLARMLDAPNVTVRALLHDDHVVSVALLAREGGLDAETRAQVYEGSRIRGNMLPDVLMSQLRDEDAGAPVGLRVLRIATHHAVRSRGLGSRLLAEIRAEFQDAVDWFGVGFGATPELVRFWRDNGYSTIHLATTRNERSGEYSILMLDPTSQRGETLHERHSRWFSARILDVLGDALRDMEPDVVRAALAACSHRSPLRLGEPAWRIIAGAAFGPALYSIDPAPFRELALHYLTRDPSLGLTDRDERLLVRKLLQLHPWPAVADELGYVSTSETMRSLGNALQPLVEEYGRAMVLDEMDRYEG